MGAQTSWSRNLQGMENWVVFGAVDFVYRKLYSILLFGLLILLSNWLEIV